MFTLNPYLNFAGNCREAFEFYKTIFDGKYEIMTFAEMPPSENYPVPAGWEDKVLHIGIEIAENTYLMGSDVPPEMGGVSFGNSTSISINLNNELEKAEKIFNKLSKDGKVLMSFEDAFWGGKYGMFVDKFGINWMVNCDIKG
jgi:PhnB protein